MAIFCIKFTFTFRKKFSINRKLSVAYFATASSREPLGDILENRSKKEREKDNFINSLTLSKDATQQEVRITKTESELSKLHTLISSQKKDSLLNRPNSEKGK